MEWSLFVMPSLVFVPGPAGQLTGITLVAKVQRPDQFKKAYETLIALARVGAARQGNELRERIGAGNVPITYMPAQFGLSPSVALSPTHLVVALSVDTADAVLRATETAPAEQVVTSDEYRTALAYTGSSPGFGVAYQRSMRAEDIAEVVTAVPLAGPTISRFAARRGVPPKARALLRAVDVRTFPSAATLTRHAIPSIAVGWTDEDGVGLTAWGPVGITAGLALGAGAGSVVALPEIVRQHERREQTACLERMQLVVKGLAMYAEDHGGAFPPKLEELVPAYLTQKELFVCPSTGAMYAYVSGMTNTDPGMYTIVYETEGAHRSGGHVGTVGGQVTWRSNLAWVDRMVTRQVQQLQGRGRKVKVIRPGGVKPAGGGAKEFF
jgi:hypothetical protein